MAELIIEDIKSLFDPITVRFGGKVYTVRYLDRKAMRLLDAYDKKLSGNPDVMYERLESIFDVKPGTFDHLESSVVAEISGFVIKQLYTRKRKKVMEPGKKESKQ